MCLQSPVSQRVANRGVVVFRISRVLTRMGAFTHTAQVAGNLSTVHWKLLLSRDWGRAPTLAPSLPRIFSILSAILYLGNINYRKRATGRDEGLEVGPPEALDTLSQLLKVLSLGLSHSGRPLRPKLPALAEPLSAASSPAVSLPHFFSLLFFNRAMIDCTFRRTAYMIQYLYRLLPDGHHKKAS